MVLECGPTAIVGVAIVRIVVVAIVCPRVRGIGIVVIAPAFNSIVGVISFSIYPYIFILYKIFCLINYKTSIKKAIYIYRLLFLYYFLF